MSRSRDRYEECISETPAADGLRAETAKAVETPRSCRFQAQSRDRGSEKSFRRLRARLNNERGDEAARAPLVCDIDMRDKEILLIGKVALNPEMFESDIRRPIRCSRELFVSNEVLQKDWQKQGMLVWPCRCNFQLRKAVATVALTNFHCAARFEVFD
jgi:hypothetical protein